MLEFHPSRDEYSHIRPPVIFRFYRNKKTGKVTYRKYYIFDLRYYKRGWQQNALPPLNDVIKSIGNYIFVLEVPRRSGKTWLVIHFMLTLLMLANHFNPCGNFYCLLQSQALRNAIEAIERAILRFPGAYFKKTTNTLHVPWPQKNNPSNEITIELKGVRGGAEIKVGNKAHVNAGDEVDGFSFKFIDKSLITPGTDHDGVTLLAGTDFGNGVLKHYVQKARNMMRIRELAKKGQYPHKPPKSVNNWHHYEGDSYDTKVYSSEKLDILKELMHPDNFATEFMKQEPELERKYFYYRKMYNPEFEKEHLLPHLVPDPNLPMWVYYDLGQGEKRDMMAIILCQIHVSGPQIFWGATIPNSHLRDPIIMLRDLNPYHKIPILEHVLPHDGMKKDNELVSTETKIRRYLAEYRMEGKVRSLDRPKDKKVVISDGDDVLGITKFQAVHAFPVWEGLKNYSRKKVDEQYQDVPSKTKYRDLVDAFLLAAQDFNGKEYLPALRNYRGGLRNSAADENGNVSIQAGFVHPTMKGYDNAQGGDSQTFNFAGF